MNDLFTISIVTWNSEHVIAKLLDSIRAQQGDALKKVYVFDNNSQDQTRAIVSRYPEITLISSSRNIGFSGGHNTVFALVDTPYVICVNPDVVLTPNFLVIIAAATARYPDSASFGGKLLRAQGLKQPHKSGIVDCTGLQRAPWGSITNRGEGKHDDGSYDAEQVVFGHSGALAVYSLSAMQSVSREGEYFDNDFFAYKEDADLAWRLQRAGYTAHYIPKAVAYHERHVRRALFSRSRRATQYLSYRNHLYMLIKNIDGKTVMLWGLPIFLYELLKAMTLLFTQPITFCRAIHAVVVSMPRMIAKRGLTS